MQNELEYIGYERMRSILLLQHISFYDHCKAD